MLGHEVVVQRRVVDAWADMLALGPESNTSGFDPDASLLLPLSDG